MRDLADRHAGSAFWGLLVTLALALGSSIFWLGTLSSQFASMQADVARIRSDMEPAATARIRFDQLERRVAIIEEERIGQGIIRLNEQMLDVNRRLDVLLQQLQRQDTRRER